MVSAKDGGAAVRWSDGQDDALLTLCRRLVACLKWRLWSRSSDDEGCDVEDDTSIRIIVELCPDMGPCQDDHECARRFQSCLECACMHRNVLILDGSGSVVGHPVRAAMICEISSCFQ